MFPGGELGHPYMEGHRFRSSDQETEREIKLGRRGRERGAIKVGRRYRWEKGKGEEKAQVERR